MKQALCVNRVPRATLLKKCVRQVAVYALLGSIQTCHHQHAGIVQLVRLQVLKALRNARSALVAEFPAFQEARVARYAKSTAGHVDLVGSLTVQLVQ